MKKILFIINPHSGKVRNKDIEGVAKRILSENEFQLAFAYTEYAGHAPLIAKQAVADGYDIIVAIGGDGTIHEVSSALIHTNATLAIIPMGSGNGFARFLKIPRNVEKAIQLIAKGKTKTIDTILCNNEPFVNIAGFGFDAKIGHLFAENCDESRGGWNYIKLIIREYFRYPQQTCTFTINGKEEQKSFFIASIANSNQYGLDAAVAPNANISDGKFELVLLKEMPIYDIIPITIRLFTNQFHKSRHVETIQLEEVSIHNNEHRLLHLDGEPRTEDSDITFKIQKSSLQVIVR